MPAARSGSGASRGSGAGKSPGRRAAAKANPKPKAKPAATKTNASAGVGDSVASLAEQLANRIIRPLDLVMLSRERIQDTLDEAAERGRITRADANELVSELVQRGRAQTNDLLSDIERMLERGRKELESATKRARRADRVDRIVRSADKARRSVRVGPSFPILGYDELTARQVQERLAALKPAQLRAVREYERKHANRKSVLAALDKALA